MDFDSTGRMFITEQRGVVRVYQNGQLLPTPFLDIQNAGELRPGPRHAWAWRCIRTSRRRRTCMFPTPTTRRRRLNRTGLAGPDGGGQSRGPRDRFTADAATGYNTAVAGQRSGARRHEQHVGEHQPPGARQHRQHQPAAVRRA